MSKRKWKVYTTDELKERFTPKPGQAMPGTDDPSQKIVVPNMKRRNSAPPGMIHFPPGTFSANSSNNNNNNATSHHSYPLYNLNLFIMHHRKKIVYFVVFNHEGG